MGKTFKYCCENRDCKRLNTVEETHIKELQQQKLDIKLICGTCGYAYKFSGKIGTERGPEYCGCIPFLGTENRLPTGRLPGGVYKDYLGNPVTREAAIDTYGVDPETYLNWKDAGFPKPKSTCH
jgi:hypothetical protein